MRPEVTSLPHPAMTAGRNSYCRASQTHETRDSSMGDSRQAMQDKDMLLSSAEAGDAAEARVSSPLVSVIIVNFNAADYLQAAIDSLGAQTFRDFELILFDNASTDGSADSADLSGLPSFRLVCSTENLGFAAGNNRAAEMARGKWLVLLNPDAVAAPDWLEKLMRAAKDHPRCASFASVQYQLGAPDILDGAGDNYLIFGMPWRGGSGRAVSELPGDGWCFSACGASAMYSTEVFRDLGGFDERFFCYCEDVDLGFRLQLAGYDCRFVRGAVVHHAGSGISGSTTSFTIYHGTRNRLMTHAKNMPGAAFWLTLPGHVALSLYLLVRSSFTPRFTPMLKGYIDGLKVAVRLRTSKAWRVEATVASRRSLLKRMAWNPLMLSARKIHVRADQPSLTTHTEREPAKIA